MVRNLQQCVQQAATVASGMQPECSQGADIIQVAGSANFTKSAVQPAKVVGQYDVANYLGVRLSALAFKYPHCPSGSNVNAIHALYC